MKHLHKKIFIAFLTVHIIVITTIGVTSYTLYSNNIQNKLYDSIELSLKLTEKNLLQKISDVNKYLNYVNANKDIQMILRESDFTTLDYAYARDINDMKEVLDTYYYDFTNEVEGILIAPFNGSYYVDNGYIDDFDVVLTSSWYEKIIQSNGKIEWFGMTKNPLNWKKNQVIIVGRLIYDTKYIKDLKPLGAFFLLLNPSVFIQKTMDEGNQTNYLLYDKNMNAITPLNDSNTLVPYNYFNGNNGTFDKSDDNGKNIYSYTTLSPYGWKLVQYIPYDYFIYELKYIGYITFLIFFASIIAYGFIYYFVAKKMTMPINILLNAMKKVSNKNFDIKISLPTNDEIGLIAEGFNEMVSDIKNLFDKVVEEEKQKRKAEMQVLQYQINPHFLFNTFNSISAIAEQHNVMTISQIITALSKLLRTVLKKSGQLITIEEEIQIAKEYVFIQQVRYKERIQIEYNIDSALLQCKIPCMLLQPLIENAITHGLSRKLNMKDSNALIRINIFQNYQGSLFIEIWDNGRGMSSKDIYTLLHPNRKNPSQSNQERSMHIGIANTNNRLQYLFGKTYGLSIKSIPLEYLSVLIHLPLLQEKE